MESACCVAVVTQHAVAFRIPLTTQPSYEIPASFHDFFSVLVATPVNVIDR